MADDLPVVTSHVLRSMRTNVSDASPFTDMSYEWRGEETFL